MADDHQCAVSQGHSQVRAQHPNQAVSICARSLAWQTLCEPWPTAKQRAEGPKTSGQALEPSPDDPTRPALPLQHRTLVKNSVAKTARPAPWHEPFARHHRRATAPDLAGAAHAMGVASAPYMLARHHTTRQRPHQRPTKPLTPITNRTTREMMAGSAHAWCKPDYGESQGQAPRALDIPQSHWHRSRRRL